MQKIYGAKPYIVIEESDQNMNNLGFFSSEEKAKEFILSLGFTQSREIHDVNAKESFFYKTYTPTDTEYVYFIIREYTIDQPSPTDIFAANALTSMAGLNHLASAIDNSTEEEFNDLVDSPQFKADMNGIMSNIYGLVDDINAIHDENVKNANKMIDEFNIDDIEDSLNNL